MSYHLRWTLIGWFVCCWATPALAIDDSSRAAARALVNEGVALFRAGHFEEAQGKFADALAVARVPTVAVWAAQTQEKLGHWVAAAELYESALLMQPNELWVGDAQTAAQEQARTALNILKTRIPTTKIDIKGAPLSEVEVTIDGTSVPSGLLTRERPMDPGQHTIVAQHGAKSVTRTVVLAEGEKSVVSLELPAGPRLTPGPAKHTLAAPVPTPTSPTTRVAGSGTQETLGWVGIGSGAAGLVVGTVAGIVVAAKHSRLVDQGCSDTTCTGVSFNGSVQSYNTWRTVSTVGFVVGGVSAVAGLSLLLLRPRSESPTQLAVVLRPDSVSLGGAF